MHTKTATQSHLCLSLSSPTLQEALELIKLHASDVGMAELRLDLLTAWDFEELKTLRARSSLPLIYTLRFNQQKYSQEEHYALLEKLIDLKPAYLDVGCDLPIPLLKSLQSQAKRSNVALIHSYHHVEGAYQNLDEIYQMLVTRSQPGDYIKIATLPQTTLEALQLLQWVKKHDGKTIALGMGECGSITRILAPCVGVPWSYTYADTQSPVAVGQLPCAAMRTLYRYPQLRASTSFYGLLGNPVNHSISHWSHNLFFHMHALPAVYVKLKVTPEELPTFLPLAKDLGFKGFSVTHPLKEQIIPHLDLIDPEAKKIGAVNTLRLEGGKWVGYNTDGYGALRALTAVQDVKNKRALILGSGGCAKAVAYTLKAHGCSVDIMSRNMVTGMLLAKSVEGTWIDFNLDVLPKARYDFLIQATSSQLEVQPSQLPSAHTWPMVVMETKTAPRQSLLVQAALAQGQRVVYGHAMFEAQALKQMQLWLSDVKLQEPLIQQWFAQMKEAVSTGVIPTCI